MKAALIDKVGSIKFITADAPVLSQDNEVLIRVVLTGICGSEVHAFHGKHPFRIPPVISGHECSGVVEAIGSKVSRVRVGDRVTVEPHYGCGHCRDCASGHYNLCKDKKVLGTQTWQGSFGEYIVVPEQTIVLLPDNVSFEQGALIEPVAVGVHAVRSLGTSLGDSVAILGAGPIGLGIYLAAKASGATKIFITDALDYNLEVARQMGCEWAINPVKENAVDIIMEQTDGIGVDNVFLGVGVEPVLNDALKMCRRRGSISEVGLFGSPPRIDIHHVQIKELRVQGSNMYVRSDFEIAVDAIANGNFDTSRFVSRVFPIEEVEAAMRLVDERKENVIKVLLKF